jgi:hypothetical protein
LQWGIWLFVGCALISLAAAALLGLWARPGADDWCFLPRVRDEGMGAIVDGFYNYSNGRLVNALFVEAYSAFGVLGLQLFATFSVMLTVTVLWALASQVWRVMGFGGPRGLPALAATIVSLLFLLGSADTYHTLYFAAANVSHTLPPVLACAVLWGALAARTSRQRWVALGSAAFSGACIALLSEETTVVCGAVLAAVLLFARWLFAGPVGVYALKWALCGLGGLAVGTAILMTSPGGGRRRGNARSPLAPELLWDALHDWGVLLAHALMTWQYVAALALGALIGLLAVGGRPMPFASVRLRFLVPLSAAVFLVAGYGAIILVRPVYGNWTTIGTRFRNDYLLLFILLFVVYGALLGRAVRGRAIHRSGRWAGVAAVCALAVCGVTTVSLAPQLYTLGKEMRVRAAQWDRQSAWLHRKAAAGATSLPYKRLPISQMREPFQGAPRADWVAPCVARYYRVDTITESPVLP